MSIQPPHIIQVSSYYPPHLGGQENAVHGLATQLAKRGHAVSVLTSAHGSSVKGRSQEANVRVHRLQGPAFGHAPIMPWFGPALWQTIGPRSVIHVHIGQAFTPEMVWLVARLRRTPYIAQLHIDFEPSGPTSFLLPFYKQVVLRRVIKDAAAVITLNHHMQKLVQNKYGYRGPTPIIHNGLDESYFNLTRTPLPQKPPKILRLLFVGRLSKQKNVPVLLHALAATKRPVHLDIVGQGDQQDIIAQTIATLGLKNVTLHGRLSRQETMPFYQKSHALVMPSLYEAQPMVLLEAMAARIPIIGTRVVGVEEHIQGAAILAQPTAKGLAKAIAQFDQDYNALPALVDCAHRRAQAARWKNTIPAYQELYEKAYSA